MRILFLGFAVSDDMFQRVLETDAGLPAQTQRFGWSVVDALGSAGVTVDLLSAEPRADYPHNSQIRIRGRQFDGHHIVGESLGFINVTGLKHVSRFYSAIRSARRRRGGDIPDAILVHGVHSPFLWVALRQARRWGIPALTIITDEPSLRTRYDNPVTGLLKLADRRLIERALERMDGVIALAPALAEELAPGVPSLLMEGIVTDPSPVDIVRPDRGNPRPCVVYAGSLHEAYGVLDLIGSLKFSSETWDLRIYGRGSAEETVARAAALEERLEYRGALPPAEMAAVYAGADVLVNPRPPDQALASRSFPSKLLEYMATGVPVVTTDLPNIPADYREHLEIAQSGPRGLAEAIDALVRQGRAVRARRGANARAFILETRGIAAQGRAMKSFIDHLT